MADQVVGGAGELLGAEGRERGAAQRARLEVGVDGLAVARTASTFSPSASRRWTSEIGPGGLEPLVAQQLVELDLELLHPQVRLAAGLGARGVADDLDEEDRTR